MKKFIFSVLILCCSLFFTGCKTENVYLGYISDLKQDFYVGGQNGTDITAFYGFREEPFINDGKVGEKIYGYTFKLAIIPDDVRRSVEFTFDNKTYSAVFSLDGLNSEYKAFIEIKHRFDKEFTINLICGSEKTAVTLRSVVPENCISYETAIDVLTEKQQPLLNAYTENGVFSAEIYMRVFIHNDAPYWYVGIASGNGKLKALLIDGISGEILAVRDII